MTASRQSTTSRATLRKRWRTPARSPRTSSASRRRSPRTTARTPRTPRYGIGLAHFDMERLGLRRGRGDPARHHDPRRQRRHRQLPRALRRRARRGACSEAEQEVVEAIATQAVPATRPARSPLPRSTDARALRDARRRSAGGLARGDPRARSSPTSRSIVGQRDPVARARAQHRAGDRVELGLASRGDVALHRAAERRRARAPARRSPCCGSTSLGALRARRPRSASSIAPSRSARSSGVERISPSSLS